MYVNVVVSDVGDDGVWIECVCVIWQWVCVYSGVCVCCKWWDDECIWWWYGVYVYRMSEGGMKWVWGYVCLIRVCWVWYRVIVCVVWMVM